MKLIITFVLIAEIVTAICMYLTIQEVNLLKKRIDRIRMECHGELSEIENKCTARHKQTRTVLEVVGSSLNNLQNKTTILKKRVDKLYDHAVMFDTQTAAAEVKEPENEAD